MADLYRSGRMLEKDLDEERMGQFLCNRCRMLKNSSSKLKAKRNGCKILNMCLKSACSVTTCLKVLLLIWVYLTFVVTYSDGFNLDISKAVRFDGNTGSYFGFTVEMMNKDSNNKWILIGAPKDENPNLPSAASPGALYKATPTGSNYSISQVFIDDKIGEESVDYNGTLPTFEHGRNNSWLGASLDVNENQGIVVCASRWYNRYFLTKDDIIYMNGLCYLVPLDFEKEHIKKIPALINKEKQSKGDDQWNYGMGCLGSAAHYTRSGNDVLLGTPGLWDWTGGFVDLRLAHNYITQHATPPTDLSELAGYAISSGIYFRDGITYFAIGAPRQDLVGAVFFISSIKTSLWLTKADHVLNGSIDTGIPMPVNSFFGAALCTVDVNNDGLEDIFVGAPMYSKQSKKELEFFEEGAIFVFLGGERAFQVHSAVLRGSGASMARFGSSISSAGDLNKDDYNDIVVGAPYENDMEGAIYIYNGCKAGIFTEYSQRIPGSTVFPGIKSFGAALSKSYSMNDDNMNDITVGAYLSDKAFLLYGQPVINVKFTIQSSVEQIDKDSPDTCTTTVDGKQLQVPCFQLEACAFYSDISFAYIDATIVIVLDIYKGTYNRISFEENRANESVRIFSGETGCTQKRNVFIRSTSDLVTPVIVSARLEESNIQSSTEIKPVLNKFDGNEPDQPVLKKRKRLEFLKDCPDNICNTDLHLHVEPIYMRHNDYFVLGKSNLDVDVTITKTGSSSYGSNLFIIIHKDVQFRKAEKMSGKPEVSCGYVEIATKEDGSAEKANMENDIFRLFTLPEIEDNEKLLSCSFGNPMSEDAGVKFRLSLAVPGLISATMLHFKFNATTLSTETAPVDNDRSFDIEAKNKVFTEFNGISRPPYITVKDDESIYSALHVLELNNFGPSILPEADLTVRYPQVQLKGRAQLYLNKTTWSCRPPCKISCSFPDTEVISPKMHFGEVGPTYYIDETVARVGESTDLTEINNIDCTKKTCTRYECSLRNISPRESAVVFLEFVINKEILAVEKGIVTFKTDSYVRFGAKHRLIANITEHSTVIFTDVQPKTPPPEPVAWWIILVSVLAGLILIAVMVLIMWKCGFFKRKKRDEMEKRMQHEGQVMVQNENNYEEDEETEKKPL